MRLKRGVLSALAKDILLEIGRGLELDDTGNEKATVVERPPSVGA